jgi:hypothetical protein
MIFMKLGLSPEEARHRRVQAVLLYKAASDQHSADVATCLQF